MNPPESRYHAKSLSLRPGDAPGLQGEILEEHGSPAKVVQRILGEENPATGPG